ncbi:MAG: bifunctional DNA-formamidopyrimidine glycosylase/DNA-(apurinic or apyrimidinic site) lyase [Planctomycetes bacterium]|nr:bifunctional DNA-formamidopyrimidine glycosylase/DNA-(apurinic or apyrimidinic site) lyase [Planctomycetota bacterium]
MPELPEVETMRRGLLPIVGGRIDDACRTPCPRKPIAITPRIDHFRRRVVGCRVDSIGRVGKRVIVRLDSGDAIVLEPRMTGLVLLADPPTRDHLRFRLALSNAPAGELFYWDRRGLGSVRLLSPEQFAEVFSPERIGPDALAITSEELQERLGTSRRAIKVALLDQRAVAGIGNLYASEILHLAEVHPAKRCDLLRARQWQRIQTAIGQILNDAIAHEGSTLSDGTYRNALNQQGGYQHHHQVYDREGQPCPRCKTEPVIRIVQAQRSTFYCRRCQTKK